MRDSADLIEQYRLMHAAAPHFPGRSMMPFVAEIKLLVVDAGTTTMLDYGCGQGWVYERLGVDQWWGVMPTLYDPAVERYAARPEASYGGVICCDVLEHLAEQDIDHYLEELREFTAPGGWCLISVCCRAAARALPDGRNAHQTIKPEAWWRDRVANTGFGAHGKAVHLRFTP